MILRFLPLQAGCLAVLLFSGGLTARVVAADAGAPPPDLSPPPAPVIVAGPGTARLRIEALGDQIVRLWFKPAGDFSRKPSLATTAAPTTRVPLVISEEAGAVIVSTQALTIRIDRATLGFDVITRGDGIPLIAHGCLTAPAAGVAWTFTHQVAAEEKFFGLGEDNENPGRLDRRGTIRDLWAGQKIESGNVTAQYPIPFLLSTGRHGQAYGVFYRQRARVAFRSRQTVPNEVRCRRRWWGNRSLCYRRPAARRRRRALHQPHRPPFAAPAVGARLLAEQMHLLRLDGDRRSLSAAHPSGLPRRRHGDRRRLARDRERLRLGEALVRPRLHARATRSPSTPARA